MSIDVIKLASSVISAIQAETPPSTEESIQKFIKSNFDLLATLTTAINLSLKSIDVITVTDANREEKAQQLKGLKDRINVVKSSIQEEFTKLPQPAQQKLQEQRQSLDMMVGALAEQIDLKTTDLTFRLALLDLLPSLQLELAVANQLTEGKKLLSDPNLEKEQVQGLLAKTELTLAHLQSKRDAAVRKLKYIEKMEVETLLYYLSPPKITPSKKAILNNTLRLDDLETIWKLLIERVEEFKIKAKNSLGT